MKKSLPPGGTLVVNQSMVDRDTKRTNINVIFVPCNEIAEEIGDKKLMNMVAMGAFIDGFTRSHSERYREGTGRSFARTA